MIRVCLLIIIIFSYNAYSVLSVGSGFSNVTGGRTAPMIYGGFDTEKFALVASAVGVKTSIYYHSSYQVGMFLQNDWGEFWWGKLRAGIGSGLQYSVRGYRNTVESSEEKASDLVLGLAIRVRWNMAGPVFVALETVYGLAGLNFILLSTQHTTNLVFGVGF